MMPAGLPWYRVLFPLLTALLLLPIWMVELVPLPDLPLHMAHSYAYHFFDANPSFATYLQVSPHLRHNAAIDLILHPLLSIMSLERATQWFLTLYVLLFSLGCHWFGRALRGNGRGFGPPHAPMLACLFLSYHSMFLYGYVNFAIGLALALVVLALRVAWANAWNLWRLALLAVLCVGAYVFHLSAIAILGFAWGIWTLCEIFSRRRLVFWDVAAFAAFLPAAALYLFWANDPSHGATAWSAPLRKGIHLLAGFTAPSLPVTLLTSAVCLGALAAALWGFRRTLFFPPFLAGAAFLVLFLVSPNEFHNGSDADVRFVPIALFLLTASVPPAPATGAGYFPALLLGATLAVLLVRQTDIAAGWLRDSGEFSRAAASLNVIEPGALVYNSVWAGPDPAVNRQARIFTHLAALATPRRQARYAVFSTIPAGTWPVSARPDFVEPTVGTGQRFDTLDWNRLHTGKVYFWTYGLTAEALDELRPHTRTVYESGPVRVLRVLERIPQP